MPPAPVDWNRRAEPEELPELMDGACSFAELRACLHDLATVNRLSFGYRPTLAFLHRVRTAHHEQGRAVLPLRILDVGCGGGDALRRIAAWAMRHSFPVTLTGIDLNPDTIRVAREFTPAAVPIRWLTGNALTYTEPADIILSSLLTHHLASSELVRFLAWMESTAGIGWFVNDLERAALPFHAFGLMARLAGWHRFVQHDGPVSFRRSFRRENWQRLLEEAAIPLASVSIEPWRPARLCVGRLK